MIKITSLVVTGLLTVSTVKAQVPAPGAKQTKSILLWGATVHVGNGKVLEGGAVGFKDGKISFVASGDDLKKMKLDKNAYDTTINIDGKHVYPGFIAPNSTLGLSEIDEVRATKDFAEVGQFNPHVRSLIAFNTDSKVSSTVRTNGVLYAQVTPRNGTISGKSSILSLDGWNWEDAVLKTDDGIHVNFPNSIQRHGWWAEPEPSSTNDKYTDEVNKLKKFFTDANYYCNNKEVQETNLRCEAMRPVFEGKASVYFHANYVKDIIGVVNFSNYFKLKNVVVVGGRDAWKVTKLLKENSVSVMVNRLHDLPNLEQEDVDQPFKLPYLLQKDSVLFCIQNEGDMEGMNTRNLPFLAGTACAYGLTKEQALAAITYNAAKIMKVDDKIGTIETGKNASLIVSTGDALDMRTNNIEWAFIDGRKVNLNNTQKDLYNKYMNKYNLPK
ncbi:MAG: amidohydrolase family protein [Bacteroidota bacterium]|nr:amidohydrolase family protein [Bacteroidota bacterium]